MSPPPDALIASLVDGPSPVRSFVWHPVCASTNLLAAEAAAAGAPEIAVVAADLQTAGRGRRGRSWMAPAGTSLLHSLVLRPPAGAPVGLLPLLAGLALAETVERHLPGVPVALKWPNDLLVGGRKAAGLLAAAQTGAVVLGVGVDVDWRGVARPEALAGATSLAEAAGRDVDRWRVMAGFLGVFGVRYATWRDLPTAFLAGYRQRCATLGADVRVELADGVLTGRAEAVGDDGLLVVRDAGGTAHRLAAGDVAHLR